VNRAGKWAAAVQVFAARTQEILEQDAEPPYIGLTQAGLIGHRLVIASAKGW
jgi:hypothetical protein